ncbi:MAG: 16S rRNA (adenine(1518)-N(6)/adenine(1519)-N(6))-dimethyltransferase RsmA [Acidimicrobiia bacterium]|nr:16S rRNA (adenine(1518)-N(6)/adenine(1519)-N(6))-dimethyltransferase RsmA [Acidimicrobiia bacterium]
MAGVLQETWFPLADRHQSQVTHTLRQTREILCRYGLEPQRRLGQNFVVDPNTVRRIAKLSGASSATTIVEIGGGLGALTLALAQTGAQVTTIECDKRLVAALRDIVAADNVTVVEGDATSLDWQQILKGQCDVQLVANLPYNIASTLIIDLLKTVPGFTSMLVMVQREVGERLAASVGSKAVGIPSLLVAYHGTAKIVGRVPATVFFPQPNVDSVLVQINRHHQLPLEQPLERIEVLLRAAFNQRRKMLRRSLHRYLSEDGFATAGVDSEARPETLPIRDWSRLAAAIDKPPPD